VASPKLYCTKHNHHVGNVTLMETQSGREGMGQRLSVKTYSLSYILMRVHLDYVEEGCLDAPYSLHTCLVIFLNMRVAQGWNIMSVKCCPRKAKRSKERRQEEEAQLVELFEKVLSKIRHEIIKGVSLNIAVADLFDASCTRFLAPVKYRFNVDLESPTGGENGQLALSNKNLFTPLFKKEEVFEHLYGKCDLLDVYARQHFHYMKTQGLVDSSVN